MILFFDTETTGLRPGQICQLSYVMQSGECLTARNLFFTVDFMEKSAQAVHGFSLEKLALLSGGKRFCDHVDIIEKDFSSADLVIAHNTAFDFSFMRAEFERLNKIFSVKREFCSMKKSVPICKLIRASSGAYKYPKLSELCAHFKIDNQFISDALYKVFGASAGFHDARFDTTAVLLAINKGIREFDEYKEIREFL